MPILLKVLVTLALISSAPAFPLSALSVREIVRANQLTALHDGTYLAIFSINAPADSLSLDPRVQGGPFANPDNDDPYATTEIVARLHPANSSVIWAHAISNMKYPAFAVVDDTHAIYVMGGAFFPVDTYATLAYRILRFSLDGKVVWGGLYGDKSPLSGEIYALDSVYLGEAPDFALADARTLAVPSFVQSSSGGLRMTTIFVDTITRRARQIRLPLPNRPKEAVMLRAMAADTASGAVCTAAVSYMTNSFTLQRLFVQCANTAGGSEMVTRVLVPFTAKTMWYSLRVIMASGNAEEAAALYVIGIRLSRVEYIGWSEGPNNTRQVTDMLIFKLNPATLKDVEWESRLVSTKPTMRRFQLPNPIGGNADPMPCVEYIRDRNTLVVLYRSPIPLSRIATLSDGTIAFVGNSSMPSNFVYGLPWLLFFGDNPKPTKVRIPLDPRPNGKQDVYDLLTVNDLELAVNKRSLYLFGSLSGNWAYGMEAVAISPFSLPKLTTTRVADAEMGGRLGGAA